MEEAGIGDDDDGEASCMYTCRANQKSPTIVPVSLKNHRSKAKVALPCRRAKRAPTNQPYQIVKMANHQVRQMAIVLH